MAAATAISADIIKPKFDTIFKNTDDMFCNGWLVHLLVLINSSDWTATSITCCDSGDVTWIDSGWSLAMLFINFALNCHTPFTLDVGDTSSTDGCEDLTCKIEPNEVVC